MHEKILSLTNQKIKRILKLKNKKYRDEYSVFCIENFKIINDASREGFIFEELFVSESFIAKNSAVFLKLINNDKTKKYFIISDKICEKISNLETPSGICAIYKKKEVKLDYNSNIIYLNEINDPGNLGTILRSALAFGFKNIVVDEKCADIYNYKTLNAAKDSIFKLNIAHDKNLNILKKIKKTMPLYCSRMENAGDIGIVKPEKKYCVIFGNESRGVDNKIQKLSDKFIKISIRNIESLNVAVAASIIMHKFSGQSVD